MVSEYDRANTAAEYIRIVTAEKGLPLPTAALVLGSGLQRLTDVMQDAFVLPYEIIPEFPVSTVSSHAGELWVGRLSGRPVFVFSGRFHFYEGYDMRTVTFYIRVLHLLGVRSLFLSNAAGGVNPSFCVGDLMLITDHIKLDAESPVRGENDSRFTKRFFDMSRAYSPRLLALARRHAERLHIPLQEGVYFYMGGPQFETPAEIRAIRMLGGDAVGMSTVPETIVANGCGMDVLGISCITNMAAGILPDTTLSDDEVRVTADRVSLHFIELVNALAPEL